MKYDRKTDRFQGHDYPGSYSSGFVRFEQDEMEVGARAAMALDEPEQGWWETIGRECLRRDQEADNGGTDN